MKNVKKVLVCVGLVLVGATIGLTIRGYSAGIRYDSDLGFYDRDDYRKTIRYCITKDPKHLNYEFDHLSTKGIWDRMIDDCLS